jgi:type II pantothenate kinase|tara:strand:- start:174 stop:995 length:822 start_codon:yes stop_codon:yes gene_type:complete
MNVAFDFGISNTDIAVQRENKITFFSMPTKAHDVSLTLIQEILATYSLSQHEVKLIGVTGGKSSDLPNHLDSIPVIKINEVDAIGIGAKVLYNIKEEATLVMSTGTGTACVLVKGNSINHLGGIAIGGGMLEGLGSLLFQNSSGQEINEFATQGSRKKLDILIGDAVNSIGTLSPDITAVNFGKAKNASADTMENTSAALCNMVGEVIGTVAYLNALLVESRSACFLGRTSYLSEVAKGIDQRLELAGISGRYNNQREYGNVIGVIEQLKNHS